MLPATATFNKVAAASTILSEIENAGHMNFFCSFYYHLMFF